jgi:hypothetical protein
MTPTTNRHAKNTTRLGLTTSANKSPKKLHAVVLAIGDHLAQPPLTTTEIKDKEYGALENQSGTKSSSTEGELYKTQRVQASLRTFATV